MKVRQVRGRSAPSFSFGWLRSLASGFGTLLRWFWLPGTVLAAIAYAGSPNILWEYSYVPVGKTRVPMTCTYLGLDGYRVTPTTEGCSAVALFPLDLPDFSYPWRH